MDIHATIGDTITEQVRKTLTKGYADKYPLDMVYAQATRLHDIILAEGIPEPAASYALYQVYHETEAFKSPLFVAHNNGSGIKYAGQKGAVKGTNGYAWWPGGLSGWVAAFAHELRKGANPAGANSLEDFVNRLKANKYFEDSVSNYLSGMKRARLVLKVIPAADRSGPVQEKGDLDIPGSVDYSQNKPGLLDKWNALSMGEKIGYGAGGVVAVIVLVKAME